MNLKSAYGDDIPDPDGKTIRRILLKTFKKAGHSFVILEDEEDSGNYIQAVPMDMPAQEHGCRVEYRDSSLRKHFAANSVPLETTITLFQQYNRRDQGFRKAIRWRNISRKFERSTPDESTLPFSQALQDWALSALQTATEFFEAGDTMPFLLVLDEKGQKQLLEVRLASGGVSEELLNTAREMVPGAFRGASLYALVWDAFLTFEGARQDAIIAECGERGTPVAWLFAQRYHLHESTGELERLGGAIIVETAPSALENEGI